MQMKTNKNGVKLLAAVMVLIMAFAGAFVFVSDGSDADVADGSAVKIVKADKTEVGYKTLAEAFAAALNEEKIVLLSDVIVDKDLINDVSGASFTIDGQGKYKITLNKVADGLDDKGRIVVKVYDGETLTFSNLDIVNVDDNIVKDGKVETSRSIELLFYQGNVKMENVNFTGDEKVEYAFTLTVAGITGEFTNVDFNGKVVGTTDNTNTMKVTKCKDLRINYTMKSTATYTLGTSQTLEIDAESAATTTLNFAADKADITLTLDLNEGEYTFKNITERRFAKYSTSSLEIINGILKDTTFGVYVGDKDDATPADVERASKIVFGEKVKLAGKTVIGATSSDDYTTVKGTVTFKDSDSYIVMDKNAVADGLTVISSSITNPGTAVFGSVKAGDGKLTISDGSVIIEGGVVSQAGTQITVSGNAQLKSSIPKNVELIISADANVVIPLGANVTIDGTVTVEGAPSNLGSIENNGTLTINKPIAAGEITNNATVNLNSNGNVSIANAGAGITYLASGVVDNTTGNKAVPAGSSGQSFGMISELESDYTVSTNAYLQGELVIPEGVTLTVKGALDLNGENLVVKGNLVIESKGSVIDTKGTSGTITLTSTGSISNAGMIGKDYKVTVSDGRNNVELMNVTGVEFSLTKVSTKYILTLSGSISKKGTTYTFNAAGVYISDLQINDLVDDGAINVVVVKLDGCTVVKNGSLTIGTKANVEIDNDLVLNNNATLVVNGTLSGTADVHMTNGSITTVNGVAANTITFEAITGDYETYDEDGTRVDVETLNPASVDTLVLSKVKYTYLSGITLEVTSKSKTVDDEPWTTQTLNIYGTATYQKGHDDEGLITISENASITVPAGKDLVLNDDTMELSSDGATITVLGSMKVLNSSTIKTTSGGAQTIKFVGAMYETEGIDDTGNKYPVYNFTTFDNAFTVIDSAVGKEIIVSGGFEFAKDYTVKAGQTITNADGKYTIKKGATVTVESEGELFNDFQPATETVAAGIQGTLVVIDGATCTPENKSYEVSSKDADGNRTYSGAATAIENATEGSTIYITNPVIFADKTTIPAGVTVDVASGAKITAQKGLTVNGKIVNNGTLDVADSLVVVGDVENNSIVTVTGTKAAVTVTGKYTGDMAADVIVNAAKYNDGSEYVYTSIASAIEAASELGTATTVTVTGKITESADVVLAEDMTLEIAGEVVLKSITLSSMSGVTITDAGKLTADIVGAVGTVDSVGAVSDAIVALNKVVDSTTVLKYNESTKTYTMYLGDYTSGDVTIKAGSVTIADSVDGLALTSTKTLKVEADAGLIINKSGFSIDGYSASKKYFSNAGTISLKNTSSISKANIGGEVVVSLGKVLTIADSKITGTITLETQTDKTPASAVISGEVIIGTAPGTLGDAASLAGEISFYNNAAHVVVFEGNTFASDVEGVKSTAYVINGTAFAAIYAAENNEVPVNTIDTFVNDLDDLDTSSGIVWKSGSTSAGTAFIGKYATVTASIDYQEVKILISAAPGMLVYIDDFQVVDEKKLAIGQHTVTIYLQPNYEGTPAITFNGQKITDGKITITAGMIDADAPTLVVTGATPAVTPTPEPTPVPTPSEKDDSMGITEYLLIVLVILAAILVVVVAIRMMRS